MSANYTVVDMFASVVTGNATPEAAAKQAAKAGRALLQDLMHNPADAASERWRPGEGRDTSPRRRYGRDNSRSRTSTSEFTRQPDGWLTRLFDYKPFLVVLCMLPTAGLLLVFLTYPLGLGIWLSLTDATIGQPGQFIGLDNFVS